MTVKNTPLVLIVLDGFGVRAGREDNAIAQAKTPWWTDLSARYPHGELGASGPDVGLPAGQMGNSEVGHLNLGAGRVAQMDIGRIDCAVADGSLAKNPEIAGAIAIAKQNGGAFHLLGLVSDGGVHSSLEHLVALVRIAGEAGVRVVVHAFLDGRDTPPKSALGYLARVASELAKHGGRIGTVSGRYYAMDRDKRWDRVEKAYRAIAIGDAPKVASAEAAVHASYAAGKDDEFVVPVVVEGYAGIAIGKDTALFFNFRADRARELSHAFVRADFSDFSRPAGAETPFAKYVCMTAYDKTLAAPIAFPKQSYPDIFAEVIAKAGLRQLRCAETEKFAHVTYFFNGGREEPFEREDRVLVPSPRDVATYDEQPSMSAAGVTTAVTSALEKDAFDFILVNFANPDMVGHTGMLGAAIAAVEAVDAGIGAIVETVLGKGGVCVITADHGNCETMRDAVTGAPHTAHTTNPVPIVLVSAEHENAKLREHGVLADVAPTLLALLGLQQPAAMTGQSLLVTP